MAYNLTSSDSHKITFQRESTGFAATLFIVVGSIFLLIGIGLNIGMDSWAFPNMLFRILFPAFGLGAIAAGFYAPKQARESTPELITFDHDKGVVKIEMVKNGNEVGYIRYNEIEGFDIYVERNTSSSSSTRSNTTSTTYYYHVFLRKKDEGEWFLTKSGNRNKADELLLLLRTSVPLTKEPTLSFKQSLSPKIDKQEGSDKIIIHWENHVTVWSLVFLTLFAAVFLFMLVSFAMNDFGKEVFPTVILSFIFLVFCFVMGFTVKTTVKNLTTRFAVAVDKSNLEYYEFSRSSGKMRNSKSIPLAEIQHVAYSFAPSKSMGQNGLKVLTAEDVKHLKEIADKPLEAVKEIFSNKNQPLTLSIMALNPVECLQLENWLQELILKKGNQISKNL